MTTRRTNVKGTVYLLHFDKKLHHSQHYIGWTEDDDIRKRLDSHGKGSGAKIVKAVVEGKIDVCCVRIWRGVVRNFERKLKNRKNAKKLCPVCK